MNPFRSISEKETIRAHFGMSSRLVEDVHDLVDVHAAQTVLGAILHEAAAGVNHEDTLAGVRVLLIDDHDASGDSGAVERGWRASL